MDLVNVNIGPETVLDIDVLDDKVKITVNYVGADAEMGFNAGIKLDHFVDKLVKNPVIAAAIKGLIP